MKIVVQRSKQAHISIDGKIRGKIDAGLVLLVGITHQDNENDVLFLADKTLNLRIFEDENGKMNSSLLDTGGSILSISQFTLYGDCRKGRRPNFMAAARPEHAEPLYERFNQELRQAGVEVQTGVFGAMMEVSLINDGPVTLILDSKR
jgi:D-aminoacyl-tRNA deacylase